LKFQTSQPPALLVLNGKSAAREDVRAAVRAIRAEGAHLEVRVTYEPGDAARSAASASKEGWVVVAGGGDGTVNEVATGMLEGSGDAHSSASLAVLPLGTANDLAHACGIPLEPLAALRLAVSGKDAKVDIGRVNGRAFVNLATGGFGTHVTVETPPDLKKALGGAAYLLTGLTHFSSIRPDHGKFSGPGFAWEGTFLVLAVGNGRLAGGGHKLCPDALMNDGLFDVGILPTLPEKEIPSEMRNLLHEGIRAVRSRVVGTRLSRLEIETQEPVQINLDGEPISGTRLAFEILLRRLSMRLPPDCPLLGPESP
jgi:lipid kinase YegS